MTLNPLPLLKPAAAVAVRLLPDALALAGAGLLSHGAWLIYRPAGFLTAGALLLAGGVLAARRSTAAEPKAET